jgi:hypothetical protein
MGGADTQAAAADKAMHNSGARDRNSGIDALLLLLINIEVRRNLTRQSSRRQAARRLAGARGAFYTAFWDAASDTSFGHRKP